jgi:hypothetical protein
MYSKLKMLEKHCETHRQKKVVADFEQDLQMLGHVMQI